jgi:hypothetical protein
MIDGETYYLAIHLYHKFPFANPVDKHYNKVEITNGDTSPLGQWSLEKLLANPAFKNARETPPHKEPFFKHLEEENK